MRKSKENLPELEDIVRGLSTVFQDSLGRNNTNHSLMCSSNSSEVEDFSANDVWAENGRVRRKFGRAERRAEDTFSRANNHSQDPNDEDGTGANEPNKEIQSKLLSPSLPHIHTLHTPNIGEQRS